MRVEVDKDLQEIVPGFLGNRDKDVVPLAAAIESRDFGVITVVGHRIRGSSGGYGFEGLGDIGRSLEEAGKSADAEAARHALTAMREYLRELEVTYI